MTTTKPKYYYHGTIDKFVPAIFKEGLKPVNENAWDGEIEGFFKTFNPKRDEAPGYIFFTEDLEQAMRYARSKAAYFRAEPGSIVEVYGMDMEKSSKAPMIKDAKPVIVQLNGSKMRANGIVPEPDPHSFIASRYHGTIPPEFVGVSAGIKFD